MEIDWERLISAVGVPAAVLFFLLFVGWRVAHWCALNIAPHIPGLVESYNVQAAAHAAQAEQMQRHAEQLDEIKTEVVEVKTGVNELLKRPLAARS